MTLRTLLYRLARLIGDVNAVRRGPEAIGKRIVRKAVGRSYGKAMNKLFRS